MTTDPRIVYGTRCVWWDSIAKVGRTEGGRHPLPCCPRCGGALFEVPSEADWWAGVDRHEKAGNPGYRAFVEWLRGKCFPKYEDARFVYEAKR